MRCPGRIVDRGHGTRESVHDGDRDGHVTEARAGESRERAPPGPAGKANARGEGGSITGAVRRGGRGARDVGWGMGEETSGNEGFRKWNEVLGSRRSSVCACDWSPRKNRCRDDPELVIVIQRFPTPSNVLFWSSCTDSFLGPSCGAGLCSGELEVTFWAVAARVFD